MAHEPPCIGCDFPDRFQFFQESSDVPQKPGAAVILTGRHPCNRCRPSLPDGFLDPNGLLLSHHELRQVTIPLHGMADVLENVDFFPDFIHQAVDGFSPQGHLFDLQEYLLYLAGGRRRNRGKVRRSRHRPDGP